jgi:pantoate kinase
MKEEDKDKIVEYISMAIAIEKVEKLIKELQKYPDLEKFRDEQGEEFAKKNGINFSQLLFLLSVVAAQRMKKDNIKAKQDILNKRTNGIRKTNRGI